MVAVGLILERRAAANGIRIDLRPHDRTAGQPSLARDDHRALRFRTGRGTGRRASALFQRLRNVKAMGYTIGPAWS
jgi:hypothetical protein